MAGRTRRRNPVVGNAMIASSSMVASSHRYPGKVARVYAAPKEWQKEAYRHYGICGEARFAANYFGHSLSRATLFAAKSFREPEPILEGPAAEAMDALFNGSEGQAQMLSAVGKHLTIAGECYLVGRAVPVRDPETDEPTGEEVDTWEVLSCLEVTTAGTNWSIKPTEDGKADIQLADDDVVIRIWRPHPEFRMQADSPFRSLLPILREIEWLTLHIFAQCSSRMAGAGLMFITQGVEFPPPKNKDGEAIEFANAAEGLMLALANGMMESINDPGNPASYVPSIASVPEEVMKSGKIAELMHFWTDLDAAALEMRQSAVHRFALGMDLDPSKVEGMGSGASTGGGNSSGPNHWGMWQVMEETITIHIEPMLDLVCNALSTDFLRPASGGLEVVRYDTTRLRLRPDRSKESLELYNLGLLKPEVPVRENGFKVEDMLDPAGRKEFLLFKVASGSATPPQVDAALKALGVDLGLSPEDLAGLPAFTPRESRPAPSLVDHPTRDLPEAANLLLHTTEPLVLQAMQRVGNRLRTINQDANPTCPAHLTHTVIEANGQTENVMRDAFPTAALVLEGVGDPAKVVPVLDSYCRNLIKTQRRHDREALAKWLEVAGL